MRTLSLLALAVALGVALGGCASTAPAGTVPAGTGAPAPSGAAAPTVNTTRVVTGAGTTLQVNTLSIDLDVKLFVTGTPDEAWAVLPGVYAELLIPVSVNDPRTKTIGNTGWKTRRTIGRVPAQRYVECGGSGTMPNAESYSLNLSIVTTVLPNPNGGSVLSTAISGTAKNPVTSSTAEVPCTSKSELESRIRDMVQKALYAR